MSLAPILKSWIFIRSLNFTRYPRKYVWAWYFIFTLHFLQSPFQRHTQKTFVNQTAQQKKSKSWQEIEVCFKCQRNWRKISIKANVPTFISTDLGNLIGNTQCVNFRIFLPFWTHKKLKTAILNIWAALIFEFLGFFDIFKCDIPRKLKFKAFKIVKMAEFNLLKTAKIDFT